MKIDKDDIIVFYSEHYAHAVHPKPALLEMAEEEQLEFLKKVAKDYHLPMSLGNVIGIIIGRQVAAVIDQDKLKAKTKQHLRNKAQQEYEKKLQQIGGL